MKLHNIFTSLCLVWAFLASSASMSYGQKITLSNDSLKVAIDQSNGTLAVTDQTSGRVWGADPWESTAGVLEVEGPDGEAEWNLSEASEIKVAKSGDHKATVTFTNDEGENEMPAWQVKVEIALVPANAQMEIRILTSQVQDDYEAKKLLYPARQFHLITEEERGFAVYPFWQGAMVPSYIFPMNGGKFCAWDDRHHDSKAVGELKYYDWQGLIMHWFGIHDDKSAVLTVIPKDGSVGMKHVTNYDMSLENGAKHHTYVPWKRILDLSPVWYMDEVNESSVVKYYFQPGGNHVTMAKQYRKIAIEEGTFVSLKEKAKKNPDVNKLKGALYTGIYGGYPHYVNLPGMAFTFDELDNMMIDMRENLGLKRAFVHAWGTFENYAPIMWPISEELGGAERLREVVTRVKGYGWLFSSYHSVVSLLPHDPDYNLKWATKDSLGQTVVQGRWMNVDPDHWTNLAKDIVSKEMEAIGQNADVTDIVFAGKVDERGKDLAEYMASTGLVLGTERGNEWLVPYYHVLEGMVFSPFNIEDRFRWNLMVPLFNLVYHDAITNYGKIQSPNQLAVGLQGDYYIKTLRQMAYGDGPQVFFSPYEYNGVRPYIKFAADMLGPLHESIAFEELIDHQHLSPDFQVQATKYANGVEMVVNLGAVGFELEDGTKIPAYGFRIRKADGTMQSGSFHHSVEVDGVKTEFK